MEIKKAFNLIVEKVEKELASAGYTKQKVAADNGNELVARGILMEAYSVEDEGEGICFNVYLYNVQPGITIDYATGANELAK